MLKNLGRKSLLKDLNLGKSWSRIGSIDQSQSGKFARASQLNNQKAASYQLSVSLPIRAHVREFQPIRAYFLEFQQIRPPGN